MTNEDIDAATLSAVKKRFPEWEPEDDAFSPTEYWQDCGPLIILFEVDIGPHTGGKWMAYCFKDPANSVISDGTKTAICLAIIRNGEQK